MALTVQSDADDARPPASSAPTYYTITDRGFFLGTVALVNSLRLTGNRGGIVVLDRGLTEQQRATLSAECTLVRFDGDEDPDMERHPFLVKPFPHRFDARGDIVIIDSDMIVTSSLATVLPELSAGRIYAFEDPTLPSRWFPSWETELGLAGPVRRQTYVNAGFIAFSTEAWPNLLARWWELCRRLLPRWVDDPMGPLHWRDQDALNAMLMSEIPQQALTVLPKAQAPALEHLRRVRVLDAASIAAAVNGSRTVLLHNAGPVKPWDGRMWYRLRRHAYLELLPRILFGDDVPIRIAMTDVPVWLRPGPAPRTLRRSLTLMSSVVRGAVHGLPPLTRFVRRRFGASRPQS